MARRVDGRISRAGEADLLIEGGDVEDEGDEGCTSRIALGAPKPGVTTLSVTNP